MENEEKAIIIAKKNHQIYDDYYDSMQECIESAIQMALWKDEQFKEQRRIIRKHWQEWAEEQEQQFIDKACEWLKNNMYEGTGEQILSNKTYPFMSDFIEEFRKAIKVGDK